MIIFTIFNSIQNKFSFSLSNDGDTLVFLYSLVHYKQNISDAMQCCQTKRRIVDSVSTETTWPMTFNNVTMVDSIKSGLSRQVQCASTYLDGNLQPRSFGGFTTLPPLEYRLRYGGEFLGRSSFLLLPENQNNKPGSVKTKISHCCCCHVAHAVNRWFRG